MKIFHPFGMPLPFYSTEGGGAGAAADTAGADKGGGDGAADKGGGGADKGAGADGGKPATIVNALDAGPADDKQVQVPADFPADWREKMATGADGKVDAKRLDQLKRHASPLDLSKSYFSAQEKIRTGKTDGDEPMPDPAKDPEGAKAWRTARDVPETADAYKLPDDVQKGLTDADKPVLTSYTEAMHKIGMPQKYVAEGARWYTGLVAAQAEEQENADKEAATTTRDALREEWGADFKPNSTIAMRYAKEAIPGVDWYTARLPDGRTLGNVPEVVKALAKFGLAEYGDAAFAGGEQASKTLGRLEELKKVMDTNIDQWNSHAFTAERKEYFKLLEADQNRKQRTGA